MHVVTPDNPLLTHDEHMAGVDAALQIVEMAQKDEQAHFEAEKAEFQTAIDSLDSEGVDASLLVISGNAHNEIVRVVNELDVDLVILSTHGRRGVSRALLGSVADEVVHEVGVPVMIVRRS
jgi:universal stress protein A